MAKKWKCDKCGRSDTLDHDCNGNPRCEECDPPCLCCSDGPGYGGDDEEDTDDEGEEMTVNEVSFVGPNGDEVYVRFQDNDPKQPIDLYAWKDTPLTGIAWVEGRNTTFQHAQDTAHALAAIQEAGYQPIGEEADWFATGEWPEGEADKTPANKE